MKGMGWEYGGMRSYSALLFCSRAISSEKVNANSELSEFERLAVDVLTIF